MELTTELLDALNTISPEHRRFVSHAASNPAFLDRTSFEMLDRKNWVFGSTVQSWPTLIDSSARKEMERVSTGLARIIKKIPSVIFAYDAEAMSEFYHIEKDYIRHVILGNGVERAIEIAIGRGDFIKTPERWWCVEFNLASNLGGVWETSAWEEKITAVPIIADYLKKHNLRANVRNTLRLMMHHVVRHARKSLATNGEVNIAYAFAEQFLAEGDETEALRQYFADNYQETLRDVGDGLGGTWYTCRYDDLEVNRGQVFVGGKRVHALVEVAEGIVPFHLLRCQHQGTLNIHNGPVTHILCNKLNMALLSMFQDSAVFTREERELIQTHVPWTRPVAEEQSDFNGEVIDLPEFILQNRESLVLKKSVGSSGNFVVTGKSQHEWEQALQRALSERDWIVQRFVGCPPVLYQHGPSGCCPHNVIWGLFALGQEYGGAFLRLLPQQNGKVVNRQRGSVDGVVLEVE